LAVAGINFVGVPVKARRRGGAVDCCQ